MIDLTDCPSYAPNVGTVAVIVKHVFLYVNHLDC